jgi:aspartate-semialdehyde dehydrogenase
VEFGDLHIHVRELSPKVFEGADIAFFTAGGSISKEMIPEALKAGCVVVDDSSTYRMDEDIPLVIPEVNGQLLKKLPERKIFPVANCAAIPLAMVLAPIHSKFGIKRVVVSTYQSTSGAGKRAVEELSKQVTDLFSYREVKIDVFPHQIAFNVIPQIDKFLSDGCTAEEDKVAKETKKILGDSTIGISVTAVRVPTFHAHAESVNIETKRGASPEEIRTLLKETDGVVVVDDSDLRYPNTVEVVGTDDVFVGRIRRDTSRENCINLWIAADNIRKGAALNAVHILETLQKNQLI